MHLIKVQVLSKSSELNSAGYVIYAGSSGPCTIIQQQVSFAGHRSQVTGHC